MGKKASIKIPLSKNGTKYAGMYEALVSPEDADLADFNWTVAIDKRKHKRTPHAMRSGRKDMNEQGNVHMHRVIMERKLGRPLTKKEKVDHINRDGLDNRRENLRVATVSQNNRNTRSYSSHGYKGCARTKNGKWQAAIRVNGRSKHLGTFEDPLEAQAAYYQALAKYWDKKNDKAA